jgi:IS30 family transposase
VEYGERIEYGESRGTYKTIGDEEHVSIIDSYFEGSSMGKIAKKLGRSAATIHAQIHSHDESIDKAGYCLECRRLEGSHETQKSNDRMIMK